MKILILSLFYLYPCLAQTPAAMLDYLKKNIEIYYLARPNVDTLSFAKINPEGVFLDTDGIILGKKTNNNMETAALLLSALFKQFRSQNSGDILLQEIIYNIMQVKKKKVKLYIINDIAEPLRQSVLDSMQLYYAKEGNRISVWSATFPPASSESASYAGYVTMGGGDAELASLKRGLTSLFCDLATGAYGPGIGGGIYRVPNESPPKNMYLDKELNVAYAMIDTRRQVTEAISYGFYNFIPTGKNNRFFNWVASNPYVLIPSKFAPPLVFNDDPVPPKYSLVQQLVNVTLVDTGRYITFPPFPAGLDFLRLWKIYNLNSFPDKLIIQNEILLGMICFQFVEKMGQDLYSECIKRNNSSIEKAEPEDKLAVLMENLCMGTLRDKKIGQTPKNYLLPLALIDLYLDFPNMSGSSKDKQTFNGLFREGSFSISLLDAYYIERTAIKSAVDRANRMPGVKYRGSGEINLKELINAVWDQLMK